MNKNTNKMIKSINATLPDDLNPEVVKASIRERLLFQEFRNRQGDFRIKFMSYVEENDSWDVIYLSAGTEYLAEIKVRDKTLASWDHEGWILEKYKYKALCDLQNKAKRPLKKVYINIFQDAIVIWDLDAIQPSFFDRDSKAMTVSNKGRKIKSVAYLQSKDGTIYKSSFDIALFTCLANKIFNFFFPESDK